MTGKVQDMAPCLNKRVELDNCFSLMFFLDVLFSFPLLALLNSAIHVDVVFMLFTLQSCEKRIHIKNEKWIFFCTFQSANPTFIHQYHVFSFYVHLTCICKPAVLPQMISLFWWSLYSDYFDLSTMVSSLTYYKVCWLRVVLFSHTALAHTHRFQTLSWTRWSDWKAKICTMSPLTGENWWKKAGWNGKNELCGYLQWRRHGRSGHWVRKVPAPNQNTGNI